MTRSLRLLAVLALALPLAFGSIPAPAAGQRNGRILVNETFTIGSLRPDGSAWRELARGDFSSVRWSPDKSKVTYVGDEGDHLWVMDSDGTNKIVLDDLPESGGTWSADSRYLAYENGGPRDSPQSPLEPVCGGIWIVDATSAERTYFGDAPNCMAQDPQWSPDGDAILFLSGEGADDSDGAYRHVYSMDIETGAYSQLTKSGALDLHARWSPGGSKIVFNSTRDHSSKLNSGCLRRSEIYVMRSDGSRERRLTRSLRSFDCDPTWSPEGRHIAWSRSVKVEGEWRTQAWVMRPDGSGKRLLSQRPSVSAHAWDFSPDGRWLLYTAVPPRKPDAASELYKVRVAGAKRVRLTRGGVHSAPRPDW